MIDKDNFYKKIKEIGLIKSVTQDQVNTLNTLFDEWDKENIADKRQLAYILGTIYHETGEAMIPVIELDNKAKTYLKSKPYYPYIGRGLIQLTWKTLYRKFGTLLELDFIKNPNQLLEPLIAVKVAIIGMTNGVFTGVGLSKYFNDKKGDWVNARKVINGLDCASKIAGYSKSFLICL